MKRNYTIKAVMDRNDTIVAALKGKEGVYIGKSITLNCALGDNFVTEATQLQGMRVSVSHFGFDVSEYFSFVSEDKNWRKASAVCSSNGNRIESATYMVNGGWERFSHLRYFTQVEACFFLENGQPVCAWDVTDVGFEKNSRVGNSIKVREYKESLTMPPSLAKRFIMVYTEEILPDRGYLTNQISAYIKGKNNMPAEIREKFLKLADVLALTYLNAWGAHETLCVKQQPKAEVPVPATEKPVIEIPVPVSESTVLTIVNANELSGDPLDLAGAQVRAAKATPGHRKARRPTRDGASVAR